MLVADLPLDLARVFFRSLREAKLSINLKPITSALLLHGRGHVIHFEPSLTDLLKRLKFHQPIRSIPLEQIHHLDLSHLKCQRSVATLSS